MTYQPRILFYLPDDNHHSLQRYLAIAHQLVQDLPNVKQKLITKALPEASLPMGVDVSVIPKSAEGYATSGKTASKKAQRKREEHILDAIYQFQPHLLLVDRVASGLNGEILPALHFLKAWSPHTKIVYGMQDVEASPQSIQVSWQLNGIYQLLDKFYDRILFYGQRDLFDPIMAYHMPVSTAVKVVECGYLNYLNNCSIPLATTQLISDKFSILIVVDSDEAIDNCTQFFSRNNLIENAQLPIHLSLLIDSKLTIQQIRDFLTSLEHWSIDNVNFDLSLCHQFIDLADLVVCNASYASVCNVIARNKQTLYLIGPQTPPDYMMRARALFRAGLAQIHDLSIESELKLNRNINIPHKTTTPPPSATLHLNGVRLASKAIASMIMS